MMEMSHSSNIIKAELGLLCNLGYHTAYERGYFNPLPALTYQNVLDLNVSCQAKRTQTYWHVRKFKCPLKKTQPSCPCSRDLNWTGKGLRMIYLSYVHSIITYGIILGGNSPHSTHIFNIQKWIIRIMTNSRGRDSCRQLCKILEILPLQS
jgi:hypothetical protein